MPLVRFGFVCISFGEMLTMGWCGGMGRFVFYFCCGCHVFSRFYCIGFVIILPVYAAVLTVYLSFFLTFFFCPIFGEWPNRV